MKYLAFVALAQSFFCYLEAVGTDGDPAIRQSG